jgi:hypothetical protein
MCRKIQKILYKRRETRESIKTKAEVIKFRDVHDVIGMDDTTSCTTVVDCPFFRNFTMSQ